MELADEALKKLLANNGDFTKRAVTKKDICAIALKFCAIELNATDRKERLASRMAEELKKGISLDSQQQQHRNLQY